MRYILLILVLATNVSKAIQKDQAAHFLAGYAISTTLTQCILSDGKLRKDKWAAFFIPFVTTTFAGIMYEFGNLGKDSNDDILWTTMGAATGAGFSVAIDF